MTRWLRGLLDMPKPPIELNEDQIEALRVFQAQRQQARSQSKLMDPAALEANRVGQVTPQQRQALIGQASTFGIVGVVLWLLFFGAVVAATGRFLENNPVIGIVLLFGTLILTLMVVGRIASIPMRQRLNDPHLEQLSGEVIWHGANYVPESNGRLLQPIYGYARPLQPGLYTFFCLEGTHWLLSAELTGTHGATSAGAVNYSPEQLYALNAAPAGSVPSRPPSTFDVVEVSRALAQANGFNSPDLEANRAGHLSGRQVRGLLSDVFSALYGIAILLVIVVLIVVGLSTKARFDVTGLLAIAFILGLAFLMLFLHASREVLDILGRKVLSVEGTVTRGVWSHHRGRATYYYRVDGHTFTVGNAGYTALFEGLSYRIFYVPHTGNLVSIEPVS
jgi:hypothetical protein